MHSYHICPFLFFKVHHVPFTRGTAFVNQAVDDGTIDGRIKRKEWKHSCVEWAPPIDAAKSCLAFSRRPTMKYCPPLLALYFLNLAASCFVLSILERRHMSLGYLPRRKKLFKNSASGTLSGCRRWTPDKRRGWRILRRRLRHDDNSTITGYRSLLY